MPDATDSVDKNLKGFSITEKVEELKRKLHLKRKECECYRESARTELLANERIITMMRSNNDIRRVLFAQDNGDKKMINSVLRDDKEERLKWQHLPIQSAIEEVDQKVSEAENVLNLMRNMSGKRQKTIDDLRNKIGRVDAAESYDKRLDNNKKEGSGGVTQLENELDKAVIRHDASFIINQRYHAIIEHMREEARQYPAKLDTMEQSLIQQQRELVELRKMLSDAQTSRDDGKHRLQQVEKMVYVNKREREKEMLELKLEVERRQRKNLDQFAEKDKKGFRASLLMASLDHKAVLEFKERITRGTKILECYSTMQKIKTETSEDDIEDAINRVLAQRKVREKLESQVSALELIKDREQVELAHQRKLFHDIKYSGDLTLNKSRKLLDDTHEYLLIEENRLQATRDLLDRNGKLLADVKVGVTTLLDKLTHIKLKPPQFSYCSSGDVFEEMALCQKKIEQLQEDVGNFMQVDSAIHADTEVELESDMRFQEFLESQLPRDNMRIHVEKIASHTSVYENEGPDNDGVYSREEMKLQAQRLIDLKERRVKKVVKKKK